MLAQRAKRQQSLSCALVDDQADVRPCQLTVSPLILPTPPTPSVLKSKLHFFKLRSAGPPPITALLQQRGCRPRSGHESSRLGIRQAQQRLLAPPCATHTVALSVAGRLSSPGGGRPPPKRTRCPVCTSRHLARTMCTASRPSPRAGAAGCLAARARRGGAAWEAADAARPVVREDLFVGQDRRLLLLP